MSEGILLDVAAPEVRRRPVYVPVVRCSLVRERKQLVAERIITRPAEAAAVLRDVIGESDREHLVALLLTTRNGLTGIHVASIGTQDSSFCSPREIMRAALLAGAASIIMGHNHPSGDPSPSPQDITTTLNLREAGRLLGVEVLDHVIIGEGVEFESLSQRGML